MRPIRWPWRRRHRSTAGRVHAHGIFFSPNDDSISPIAAATLGEIGRLLGNRRGVRLRIQGHADNVGELSHNLELSRARAESVKRYLVTTFGVDASRLTTEGYGSSRPMVSNDTEEGRAQNRRVSLIEA